MANRKRAAENSASIPESKGVLAATARTLGAALGAVAAKVGIASPETPAPNETARTVRKATAKKAAAKKQIHSRPAAAKPKKAAPVSKNAKKRSR